MKLIKTTIDNKQIELVPEKVIHFSGGEIGPKFDPNRHDFYEPTGTITLFARITKSEDFFLIALTKDAVTRMDTRSRWQLVVPYFPYARQDRVCDSGEPFSLTVMAQLINNLKFNQVICLDVHSSKTLDYVANVNEITQSDLVFGKPNQIVKNEVLNERIKRGVLMVSPDKGAATKTKILSDHYGFDMVQCDKVRDPATGKILGMTVPCEDFMGADVFIPDDICDGGRTFIEIAKLLRTKNVGKILLYVTHGIFSKGVKVLYENGIDEVYTTNSFVESYKDFDAQPTNVFNIETLLLESPMRPFYLKLT